LYDSKVSYSTVYLDITEVVEYTEIEEELPFIEELKAAFFGGVDFTLALLKGTAIVIAAVTPVLLPLSLPIIIVAIAALIIVLIIVKVAIKRRRRAKKVG
jgi:hypothetical protein